MDTSSIETTELLMNLMYIRCPHDGIMIKNQYMQYIQLTNDYNSNHTINIGVNYLSCLEVMISKLDKVIKQTDRPILMRTIEYKGLYREESTKIEYI
jgi:hypothetical protein